MDNEKLIELYDSSNSKYGDSTREEKIWKGIAGELNQTGKSMF